MACCVVWCGAEWIGLAAQQRSESVGGGGSILSTVAVGGGGSQTAGTTAVRGAQRTASPTASNAAQRAEQGLSLGLSCGRSAHLLRCRSYHALCFRHHQPGERGVLVCGARRWRESAVESGPRDPHSRCLRARCISLPATAETRTPPSPSLLNPSPSSHAPPAAAAAAAAAGTRAHSAVATGRSVAHRTHQRISTAHRVESSSDSMCNRRATVVLFRSSDLECRGRRVEPRSGPVTSDAECTD